MAARSKIRSMEAIKTVLELIDKSLKGELSLDELRETWPEKLEDDKFYETIYDDVETAVERYPSIVLGFFRKEDPVEYFKNSYGYKALLTDHKLINLIVAENPDTSDLLEMRSKLLE